MTDQTTETVALVSGANQGLGKEVARQLAERGMTVFMGSREPERGAAAADELASEGMRVEPVQLEVTDPSSIEAAAARIQREYGRLDVLVNNAGIVVEAPATEMDAARMRENFEVNVFGAVSAIRALLPLLRASGSPRIVNVSSTTASLTLTSGGTDFGGDAGARLAYSSSKAALNMLTIQYALAFSKDPEHSHIKVNSATPGYIATAANNYSGSRSVAEGAGIVVSLATLPDDGPTGGFFNDQGTVPW
jgi:NAD(P)-dependent dehydrogenase (short-subunit alcohol dehydrogenase family)